MKKILLTIFLTFFIVFSATANLEEKVLDYKISPSYSGIEQFYRTDLTNDEIEEIKEIYKNYENIYLENIGVAGAGPRNNMFNNLSELFNSTKKYIDNEKMDGFFEYIVKNKKVIINGDLTGKVVLEKKYKIIKKKFFSEKIRNGINEKLEQIPEEKREIILNKLIEKIDLIILKLENEIKIAKLEELKEIIIDFRDNINIDDVLNIDELIK